MNKLDNNKNPEKQTSKVCIFRLVITLFFVVYCNMILAQCLTSGQFWDSIINIENNEDKGNDIKLQEIISLKTLYEKCIAEKDSVYARIMHRIGALEYTVSFQVENAIRDTRVAVIINTSAGKNSSPSYAAISYSNLGYYYLQLSRYNEALVYYDSAITISKKYAANFYRIPTYHLQRANIFFKKGDFQKDVEETTLGLKISREVLDTANMIDLLNERAQAYEKLYQYNYASDDIYTALKYLKNSDNYDALANAYKVLANITADKGNFLKVNYYYSLALSYREKTGNAKNIAADYNDAGYISYFKCRNAEEAGKYYQKSFEIANEAGISSISMLACMNIAQINFNRQQYNPALIKTQQAILLLVKDYHSNSILQNPPHSQFSYQDTKNYLGILLYNKAECLLYLFKQTNNKKYLSASISTALLTDSVITDMRHEQLGQQSKLYWRDYTRPFYTNAMEACYLAKDSKLAFFFMEKSRAVLLNDQLNELGASVHLPPAETAKQEALQINIIEQQQKLSSLDEGSAAYTSQQSKLLNAKDDFEHYIKSLEQKYPAYYQYKYADSVPSLNALQKYLALNNQSFVHYFINDTVAYILGITPGGAKFIKLSKKDFSPRQLTSFLQFCSDKESLNNHYNDFALLSGSIYKTLFQPLQLPKGRVVVCADNFLIPFEALCTDTIGRHFLINDYAFSYVYSARYLMNKFNDYAAKGDFLGIAPVSFATGLHVFDLKQSATALSASANHYSSVELLTKSNASRNNFLLQLPKYTVVNIFSHARADTSDNEPLLFMADSVIHLSELQLIDNPATKLVVLSACQTNVGKNATGEGIYSLARGFASAGIPSVSATLWKADEETIYNISEIFNKNLALGTSKDLALQQAKLAFMQANKGDNDKLLPYYWANMVLVGNTSPVHLSAPHNYWLWWVSAAILILTATILLYRKRKKTSRHNSFFITHI